MHRILFPMPDESDTRNFSLPELNEFVRECLCKLGLGERHLDPVADTIVAGERDGGGSHGLYRLLMVARTAHAGTVDLHAEPVVHQPSAALVRVDGRGGFAPLPFRLGLSLLVEKAAALGIAAMAVTDCAHFAALWPEVEAVARHGLVGIACTANHAWVAPAGGRTPLFGTNPLAFGWPRPGRDPFVFDFATSAASRGDIELHRRAGRPLPESWGIDADGHPTTSPDEVLAGAMLPFGGHKGSAIALMIELLAGPLIGDLTSRESLDLNGPPGVAPLGGELVLAISPDRFGRDRSTGSAEALFEAITGQGARLPSVRRYAARRRAEANGVDVPRNLLEEIEASIG